MPDKNKTKTGLPCLEDFSIGFAVEEIPSPLFPDHPSKRHVVSASYEKSLYVMYRLGEYTKEQLLAELKTKMLERGVIRG